MKPKLQAAAERYEPIYEFSPQWEVFAALAAGKPEAMQTRRQLVRELLHQPVTARDLREAQAGFLPDR